MFSSITACQTAGAATRIVRDVRGFCGGIRPGIVEVRNAKTCGSIDCVPFTRGSSLTESLGVDVLIERAAHINRTVALLVAEVVS